jgi:hypothetical protein
LVAEPDGVVLALGLLEGALEELELELGGVELEVSVLTEALPLAEGLVPDEELLAVAGGVVVSVVLELAVELGGVIGVEEAVLVSLGLLLVVVPLLRSQPVAAAAARTRTATAGISLFMVSPVQERGGVITSGGPRDATLLITGCIAQAVPASMRRGNARRRPLPPGVIAVPGKTFLRRPAAARLPPTQS